MALAAVLLASYGGVPKAQPLAGAIVILGIAYALSTNRRAIDLKTVLWGLGLQIVFALFVLKNEWGQRVFRYLGDLITRLLDFANVGASFVFGPLGDKQAWPRIMTAVLGEEGARYSMIFAFQVLPTIIFIAALFAILYYFGVMQVVVRALRLGHAEGDEGERRRVAERGGQHLHGPDRGAADHPAVPAEDDAVGADDRDDVGHGAHLGRHHGGLHPVRHRGEAPADGGHHDGARHADDGEDVRARDRAARDDGHREAGGGADRRQRDRRGRARHRRRAAPGAERRRHADLVPGAGRAAQRAARRRRGVRGPNLGADVLANLSLQQILGWAFAPVAWAMGVPWKDAQIIGNLLGTRMVLNEFVAYAQLGQYAGATAVNAAGPLFGTIDPKSFTIATFALCGFANFSSIGIQIGGIGALAPNRRHDLARLGLRAMLAGTLANFMTATIAGFLL